MPGSQPGDRGSNPRGGRPFRGALRVAPVSVPAGLRRWHLLFAALAAVLVACLFSETVFEGKAFVGDSDRLVHELPASLLLSEAVRSGEPPLWNPYSFCGMRAVGDAQIFSANAVHVGLARFFGDSLALAHSWRFVVEAVVSLVASYLLFLPLCPHPVAAMVPALTLPLSLGALEHLNHGSPAYTDIALFPVVLLLLRDAARRSAWRNVALLTTVLYFQLTGGMYHLNLYFVVFYFAFLAGVPAWKDGRWSLQTFLSLSAQTVAALILVACIGATQFASLWQASGDSNRVTWPYERVRDEFGQPWYAVFRLFMPFIYGNGLSFPWATFGPHTNEFETLPMYPGVVPLVLAVFAFTAWRKKAVWAWWGAAVYMILAALKTDAVAIPYFLFLRKPLLHCRLVILVPVCVAFLACYGMRQAILADPSTRRKWGRGLFAAGVAVSLLAFGPILEVWTGWLGEGFLSKFTQPPNEMSSFCQGRASLADRPPDFPTLAAPALLSLGIPLAALGLGWALLARRALSPAGFLGWCLALCVLDVFWTGRQTLVPFARSSREVFPENPITRHLGALPEAEKERYRVSFDQYIRWPGAPATGDRFGYNMNVPYGIRSEGGKANFLDARYADLLSMEGQRVFQYPDRATRDPYFADLFSVRYFVVPDLPEIRAHYAPFCDETFVTDGVVVYRKREALSRYRLLAGYVWPAGLADAQGRLRAKAVALDREALLDMGPEPPFATDI